MNMDIKTLFWVCMMGYFTGALVMTALAVVIRSAPKTIRLGWGLWAFCLLLSGIIFFLIQQRGAIPDFWSIIVANALITIGFGLRPNAFALLHKQKMPYLYLPVVGTAGWFILYSFEFFREDILLRVIYINGFVLVGLTLCIKECLQLDRRQISTWFLAAAFTIDALVRASLIATHLNTQFASLLDAYQTSLLQVCFLALFAALIIKIVGISIFVFELQRKQFQQEAERDPLTGLLNQRAFIRKVQEGASPEDGPYALAVMEIDNLKEIAERYGMSMQDACMKLLARITGMTLPPQAITGLDGNGQIAVFLPASDQTSAASYIRRISQTLMSECQTATEAQVSVSLSSGIFSGAPRTPIQRALEIADYCCRKAQVHGGNKIMTHSGDEEGPLKAATVDPPFALRSKVSELSPTP